MPELYILIAAFVLAFFLAFGVGANDVANSFGTSVGSKVLTLRNACILATIFETLGAILMGQKVSDSVRTNLMNFDELYKDDHTLAMLSCISMLIGSTGWTILATAFQLPISGTHSIIGSMMGVAVVTSGNFKGISLTQLGYIVASWFLSPLLAGLASSVIYKTISVFVLNSDKMITNGLISMAFFYGFTVFINVFSIVHNGSTLLRFNLLAWYWVLLLSAALSITVAAGVWYIYVPRIYKQITKLASQKEMEMNGGQTTAIEVSYIMEPQPEVVLDMPPSPGRTCLLEPEGLTIPAAEVVIKDPEQSSSSTMKDETDSSIEDPKERQDAPEVAKIFTSLQILTAIFGAFAHGGNDVSNAIGPLVTCFLVYQSGGVAGQSPIWILAYGGLGISVGLWVWGKKVIKTLGEGLTRITPSSGFTIELGSAATVLLASKLGLPISTTHCKVGAIVFVGMLSQRRGGVDFKLFKNIALAWLCTVPTAALLSAFCQYVLMNTFG